MTLSNGGNDREPAENPSDVELRVGGNFSGEPEDDLNTDINFDGIQEGCFLLVKYSCRNNLFKYLFKKKLWISFIP